MASIARQSPSISFEGLYAPPKFLSSCISQVLLLQPIIRPFSQPLDLGLQLVYFPLQVCIHVVQLVPVGFDDLLVGLQVFELLTNNAFVGGNFDS